jgi:hypothetical protein
MNNTRFESTLESVPDWGFSSIMGVSGNNFKQRKAIESKN